MTDTVPTHQPPRRPRQPRQPVRVFWKVLTFVGFVIPSLLLALVPFFVLVAAGIDVEKLVSEEFLEAVATWFMAAAVLLSSWACLALFDHLPLRAIGLGFDRPWGMHMGAGLVLGGALVTVVWGVFVALGWAEFSTAPIDVDAAFTGGILRGVLLFGGVALLEELLLRGYAFQVIAERSRLAAMILGGLAFVALHLPNEGGLEPIAILNLFIVHVLFAVLYLRTRSLWLPVGVHAGWNIALGSVLGMAVSGKDVTASLLATTTRQGLWTGGEFGPEGGLVVTLLLVVTTICSWRLIPQQHPSPDLVAPGGPAATKSSLTPDETATASS